MRGIGALFVLLGAGSFVLHLMNRQFVIFSWIDNWGATVGTAIRIGLIVVGAALWFTYRKKETATSGD